MKVSLTIFVFLFVWLLPSVLKAGPTVDGVYTGWKPLPNISQDSSKESWYHFYTLTVKNGLFNITVDPRNIKNGEMFYSCSDGGFYRYTGEFYTKKTKRRVKMRIVGSDYARVPKNGWPETDCEVENISEVGFTLDGVKYTLQDREKAK